MILAPIRGNAYSCSECSFEFYFTNPEGREPRFCPSCGREADPDAPRVPPSPSYLRCSYSDCREQAEFIVDRQARCRSHRG